MLSSHNSSAVLAVNDIAKARDFYENKLGFKPESTMGGDVINYRSGSTVFTVYVSQFAGTNKANAIVWGVGNQFDSIVNDLHSKGITFEHYDLPGATLQGDIHVSGNMRLVWFKDPAGNILHLINQ